MSKPKVYFLGSGPIAVAPLKTLVDSKLINLVRAGTQMDRPAGRKRLMQPTPVGQWAVENDIDLDKPKSVNDEEFLKKLKDLKPDIIFVASFGQLLKNEILELPAIACVNLHASILPAYRGASPIVSAIIDGIAKTGITFMKMDKGLDTGPIYTIYELTINNQRADELESELGRLAAEHVEEVLKKIASGELVPMQQEHEKASFASKVKKEDGILDWQEPAEIIARKIRAYYPWPGVSFFMKTKKQPIRINIVNAEVLPNYKGKPGETLIADKNAWIIACEEGALSLKIVKPEGKGEMTGAEFVRGRPHLFR